MARTRSSKNKSATTVDTEAPPSAPEGPSEPSKPETVSEPESKAEAAPVAPQKPRGREMTTQEYARGKGALGEAFRVEVNLEHGRTIKHTREEWDEKFEEFMTRKR